MSKRVFVVVASEKLSSKNKWKTNWQKEGL